MLYSDLTTALGALLQVPITNAASATPSSNTDFNNILPRIIESSEQLIYREIDFLYTRTEIFDDSGADYVCTPNSRRFTMAPEILILQGVNIITPAGADPDVGTRNRLEIVSKDFLDVIWPQETGSGATDVPRYVAQLDTNTLIFAPTPDDDYTVEMTGIFRPAPLSATNTSTYLSTTYPDIFLYGCMIFATGYQRDFGAQSSDPQMAMSWRAMFDLAKPGVAEEEQRRKTQGRNWSPYSQTPLSTPRP